MKTKRWLSMVAAGAMVVSMLAGCRTSGTVPDTTSGQAAQTQAATEVQKEESTKASQTAESTEASQPAENPGKTLVVYYSAGGHTENVANVIADETGADLFILEPVEPYTSEDLDYRDENSRVSQEHENEDQRNVELISVTVEDWDSYETVFIGFPIWWGIAAWPVDSFVEENDFTGKMVIPFCTSASSDLGESGKLLAEKAGTGNWQEGMRFRSGVSEEDVRSWVSELEPGQ